MPDPTAILQGVSVAGRTTGLVRDARNEDPLGMMFSGAQIALSFAPAPFSYGSDALGAANALRRHDGIGLALHAAKPPLKAACMASITASVVAAPAMVAELVTLPSAALSCGGLLLVEAGSIVNNLYQARYPRRQAGGDEAPDPVSLEAPSGASPPAAPEQPNAAPRSTVVEEKIPCQGEKATSNTAYMSLAKPLSHGEPNPFPGQCLADQYVQRHEAKGVTINRECVAKNRPLLGGEAMDSMKANYDAAMAEKLPVSQCVGTGFLGAPPSTPKLPASAGKGTAL